jgi:hypothetical protein
MRGIVHHQNGRRVVVLESPIRCVDVEDSGRRTDRPEHRERATRPEPDSLRWELLERGRHHARASWGTTLELERRRAEPGAPAGWYLFGALGTGGFLGGVFLASRRDDAMVEAEAWHRSASRNSR